MIALTRKCNCQALYLKKDTLLNWKYREPTCLYIKLSYFTPLPPSLGRTPCQVWCLGSDYIGDPEYDGIVFVQSTCQQEWKQCQGIALL